CDSSDRSVCSIDRSSFRTGTITDTLVDGILALLEKRGRHGEGERKLVSSWLFLPISVSPCLPLYYSSVGNRGFRWYSFFSPLIFRAVANRMNNSIRRVRWRM